MQRLLFAAALAAAATPVLAADVGVSVSIGQPGFYGRIDIGDFPQPQVIYRQPILIEQVPVNRPPIYLRVPPGHAKNWGKHCHRYNACGERVYFVQDNWYNREYVPRYQQRYGERREERREEYREERFEQRGNRGNDRHGDDHEHGHGRNR